MAWSLALSAGFVLVPVAFACPVCDSGTGEQVRAGITDGQFVTNLLAILLPFAVTLGVAAVVHSGWPRRKNSAGGNRAHGAGRKEEVRRGR